MQNLISICFSLFLLIFVFQNFQESNGDEISHRIVGGEECDIKDHPYMVTILTRLLCGGALISFEWILTAAHCLKPDALKVDPLIRVGFTSPKDLIQIRTIKKTLRHPKFKHELLIASKEMRYDIGLILVNKPFKPSAVVNLINLPTKGFTAGCKTAIASGIGLTASDEKINTTRESINQRPLKCVELKLIHKPSVCKIGYPLATMDESTLCAGQGGLDTCVGDSGGPLVCKNVIVALVSFGPTECGHPQGLAIYTRIESYLDFINENVNPTKIAKKRGWLKGGNATAGGEIRSLTDWKWKILFLILQFFAL